MLMLKRRAAVRLLAKLDQQIQEAQSIASSGQLTPAERQRVRTQRRVFQRLAARVEEILSTSAPP